MVGGEKRGKRMSRLAPHTQRPRGRFASPAGSGVLLQQASKFSRNRRLGQAVRHQFTAHRCDAASRDRFTFASEIESIMDTGGANFGHRDTDVEQILESSRGLVVALDRNSWPTDHVRTISFGPRHHRDAQRTQHLVFGRFHHRKESRKVHDARRVGITKLYAATCGEQRISRLVLDDGTLVTRTSD